MSIFTKQYKTTRNMGLALITGYSDFLTLTAREQYTEVRNRKFYLLILQNEVFIKFSGND